MTSKKRDDSLARNGRVVVRNTRKQVVQNVIGRYVMKEMAADKGEVTVDCCSGPTEERP